MDLISNVTLAIKLAKMAYDLSKDAAPFVKIAYDIAINKKVITTEQHKSMLDQEIAWRAEIDAKIAEDDKAID